MFRLMRFPHKVRHRSADVGRHSFHFAMKVAPSDHHRDLAALTLMGAKGDKGSLLLLEMKGRCLRFLIKQNVRLNTKHASDQFCLEVFHITMNFYGRTNATLTCHRYWDAPSSLVSAE